MRRAGLTEDDLADINAENRKKNAVSLLDRALAATNNENMDENGENGENTENDDAANNDGGNADNANNGGNGSNPGINNAPNTRNGVKRNIKLPGGTKTPIN